MKSKEIDIKIENAVVKGLLSLPKDATAIVIFVHGSGSGRLSPRNQYVAEILSDGNLATLLMDLLTEEEEIVDIQTRALRFDLQLLTKRLLHITEFIHELKETKGMNNGYFGASHGAAAALMAASVKGNKIDAIVSRGGRPDLAISCLPHVTAPTLFIVGENDKVVIDLNKQAYEVLESEKQMEIVKGATHLFEEPGTLAEAANLSLNWFTKYLHKTRP